MVMIFKRNGDISDNRLPYDFNLSEIYSYYVKSIYKICRMNIAYHPTY